MKKVVFLIIFLFCVSNLFAQVEENVEENISENNVINLNKETGEFYLYGEPQYECGIIDINGKEIIKPKKGSEFLAFSDTFCIGDCDAYVYCDKEGKVIIPESSIEIPYSVNKLVPIIHFNEDEKKLQYSVYNINGKLLHDFHVSELYDYTFATLKYNKVLCGNIEISDEEFNSYFGLFDINGNVILPMDFDELRGDLTQDYKMYLKGFKNDKEGYYNLDGSVIIPCEYDKIGEFHNDIAACKKGDYWSVINLKGEIIFGPTKEYKFIYPINVHTYLVGENNKLGLLKDGQLVLKCEYTSNLVKLCEEHDFPDFVTLKNKEIQYVLDSNGNILFTCSPDYIIEGTNENDSVSRSNFIKFYLYGKIKKQLNPHIDYEVTFSDKEEFEDRIEVEEFENGYIIKTNEFFINTHRDDEKYKFFKNTEECENYALENNLEFGRVQKTKIYGIMNLKGNILLEPKYMKMLEIMDGYVVVLNENNKYGVIDVYGNIILPFQYDHVFNYGNGIFLVYENYEDKSYCGVFNKNKWILEIKYHSIDFCDNCFIVNDGGKNQLFNLKGQAISKKYDEILNEPFGRFEFMFLYGEELKPNKYFVVKNKLLTE